MRKIIRSGSQEIEILRWYEKPTAASFLEFHDEFFALTWLRQFVHDPLDMLTLRHALVEELSYTNSSSLDDHDTLQQLARQIVRGEVKLVSKVDERRHIVFGGGSAQAGAGVAEMERVEAPTPRAALTVAASLPASQAGKSTPAIVSPVTHCRIASISAHCSHGGSRKITGGGALEVVPAMISGDVINLTATMLEEACGNHPEWVLSGYHSGSTSGTEVRFTTRGWETPDPIKGILARILPREYRVKAHACEGTPQSLVVKAYPNNEISIKLDLNALVKKIRGVKDAADAILKQWVPKFEWQLPNGVGEFKNKWDEDPNDWRAYWTWEFSIGLSPLFGVNVRVPLSPLAAVPQYIRKYGDAYLYLEFKGETKLTGEGKRTNNRGKYAIDVSAEGAIGIQVGGNVHLMNDDCLKIDVNGSTTIKATLHNPYYEEYEGIGIKMDVDWDGVNAQISVTMLYGIVNVEQTWQLIDARKIKENVDLRLWSF